MSTEKVKVVLGEPWENHRAGTTVEVDRSRGSWLLSKGGRAANAESARVLGVAWVEPKQTKAAVTRESRKEPAATEPPAVTEKQLDSEKE